MMSDALWTICFAATGFVLVVQHYRVQRLEQLIDHLTNGRSNSCDK